MADLAEFAYETGHRSGEIRQLRWPHLEPDVIRTPGSITKNGEEGDLGSHRSIAVASCGRRCCGLLWPRRRSLRDHRNLESPLFEVIRDQMFCVIRKSNDQFPRVDHRIPQLLIKLFGV